MAVNEEVGEIADLDTTPVPEQQASEEVEETLAESTEEAEVEAPETDGEPKKGAQARIRELNTKAKQAEDRAKSLEEKLAELTSPERVAPSYNPALNAPQAPIVAPGEEIDVDEFERRLQVREQRILQQAEARSELRQRQSEAVNRINSEASEVIREFPELDPDSEQFNSELSETVTEAIEAYVKVNPYTASVKQFAAKLMKPYRGAVAKEVGQATENIARQVSAAALRPSSVRKEEKSASEKSVAQLEQELGIVQA